MLDADTKRTFEWSDDHEYFKKLCALSTSEALADREWEELKIHLGICDGCRRLLQQYREVARAGMALLMPDSRSNEQETPGESWSSSAAKQLLFERIAADQSLLKSHSCEQPERESNQRGVWNWLSQAALRPTLRYASLASLFAATIFATYQMGTKKGLELGAAGSQGMAESGAQKAYVIQLVENRAALEEMMRAKSTELRTLSEQLRIQATEVVKWKALENRTAHELDQQASLLAGVQSQYASAIANGDALNHQLQESKAALQGAKSRYDALSDQHSADIVSVADLESQIQDLSARLSASDAAVQQQQQLLAHDRDIRELMGARNLYIADVYDLSGSGKTEMPYGRVFYTTGKSLVFYAFDLDHQPSPRNAGIFQAWGRRGTTDQRPLNMGIFYLDRPANNRWVLKFDDPKALAQIDAVFVTVEPHAGSQRPSGKQLLFASLRMVASNHP